VNKNLYSKYLPITGYLDNVSGRPGDSFDVKVSAQGVDKYKADVVRIICADPNPEGPGLRYETQNFELAGIYPARSQCIDLGSYGEVPASPCFTAPRMLIGLLIQPGILRNSSSVLAASQNTVGDGWVLEIDNKEIKFSYKSTGGLVESISVTIPMRCLSWYHIWAGYDVLEGRLLLGCQSKSDGALSVQERNVELNRVAECSRLTFAAKKTDNQSADHFNGRLEDPVIYAKLPVSECPPVLPDEAGHGEIVAWWDFSIGIGTQALVDRGSRGLGGRLVNIPYR
jgi:N,N-dimethylformamidase